LPSSCYLELTVSRQLHFNMNSDNHHQLVNDNAQVLHNDQDARTLEGGPVRKEVQDETNNDYKVSNHIKEYQVLFFSKALRVQVNLRFLIFGNAFEGDQVNN
jgi:hypothetical protein